jgi:16S rRNA (guanine966-N2)-methyltransferase
VRIISGTRKGKRLKPPAGLPVRPTTDFAKEALFNILNHHFDFEDVKVLDLFSGTGSISYEFASRGAQDILAIDSDQACVQFIAKTAAQLEFFQLKAIRANAIQFLSKSGMKYDIIFADPPYDFQEYFKIPELVFDNGLLENEGVLIIEHSIRTSMGDHPNITDLRKYGSVCFSFFSI